MTVELIEETTAGRVYRFDVPLPPDKAKPLPRLRTPGPKPKQDDAQSEHVRELLCALAAERRENEALRKYSEWLTQRVQTLELQLTRK